MTRTLRVSNGRKLLLFELFDGFFVFSQIEFGPDQDDRRVGTMMRDFGKPFCSYVLERCRRNQAKTYEENVRLRRGAGVGKGEKFI